jgi:Protein of unknown function (DUF3789)
MVSFLIGLWVGAFLGVIVAGLLHGASEHVTSPAPGITAE